MAVDDIGGAYTFDGARWSTRTQIHAEQYPDMMGVSCVSETFCAAVSKWGTVSTWDGSSWSYPVLLVDAYNKSWAFDVSCASRTSCVVVDSNDEAFVLDGAIWSSSMPLSEDFGFARVSCTSPHHCLAVSGDGLGSTFDGTSWSQPTTIAEGVWGAPGVSCTTASFCGTVFSSGHATFGRPPG